MFKCKTIKLLIISLLSAVTVQVSSAANLPPTGGEGLVIPGSTPAEVADTVQEQSVSYVDFSDPTATYSQVGLGAGTEGVDVYASLGGYLSGLYEQKLTLKSMHDMDYYNIDYLAFNTSNDTGFSIETTWDNKYDEVVVGIVKKLQFEQNKNIRIYPAMKFGVMWDWDNSVDSTTFVELNVAARYSVNKNFWFGVTPNYRYALHGLDIKDLDATVEVGYQLAEGVAISAHSNNDEEVWANFSFAF
jgi:hypothetical protein